MPQSNIYIVHIDSNVSHSIGKIIDSGQVEAWLFLGRNALLAYKLEIGELKDIAKINISELLSISQYANRNDYIDFIDAHEHNTGRVEWWSSTLACKNPWISNFFLRFSQMDILHEIVNKPKEYGNNLLVMVEEYALFHALQDNYQSNTIVRYKYFSKRNSTRIKYFTIGLGRRIALVFVSLWKRYRQKQILGTNYFIFNQNQNERLVIIPTFIDPRSFRTGTYADPFVGKVFNCNAITSRKVVIIPILISATTQQLSLFNDWLTLNEYYVHPLHHSFSFYNALIYSARSILDLPDRLNEQIFKEYSVEQLLNHERLEEWSSFNLTSHLLKRFAQEVSSNTNTIQIIYPFENQKWERVLLNALRTTQKINAIGLQNAPCPKLSTRYFVAKDYLNKVPLPNHIIANGEISHRSLQANYANISVVHNAQSSRSFLQRPSPAKNKKKSMTHIMVACSIGVNESIELITFIVNTFKRSEFDLIISVVPHPLLKFDYSTLLKELNSPKFVAISQLGYAEEMKRSQFVLYDSSTAGIEGLSSGVTPVFIGHECSIHVNPNEYDKYATKYIYNAKTLLEVVSNDKKDIDTYHDVSGQYFGNGDQPQVNEILNKIIHHI